MVQIIAGDKGKGKTKYLLDKANQSIKDARGSVVYLDKSMISQNRDLEFVFLDSFLKLANLEGHDITSTIDLLEKIGEEYKITFILSVSKDVSELPENAKKDVIVSL